jgi:hypothetical protein
MWRNPNFSLLLRALQVRVAGANVGQPYNSRTLSFGRLQKQK